MAGGSNTDETIQDHTIPTPIFFYHEGHEEHEANQSVNLDLV
jgi:hypothetical protein